MERPASSKVTTYGVTNENFLMGLEVIIILYGMVDKALQSKLGAIEWMEACVIRSSRAFSLERETLPHSEGQTIGEDYDLMK